MLWKRKTNQAHDDKRLNLKRETLRSLTPGELTHVVGGRECASAASCSC
jgi:hypothetical protein